MISVQDKCIRIREAFESGLLGDTTMPEDSSPGFDNKDTGQRLTYFTLPMALNYQRDSYKLWEAALATYNDSKTKMVFDVSKVASMSQDALRPLLLKHKVALQPNKHINTWHTIATTVSREWKTFDGLLQAAENDFLKLQQIVQKEHKKGFPYLSGPKIFNYWSFIVSTYGQVELLNRDHISIAPDTHITQASVKLGVITADEALMLSKDKIALRWRELFDGSGIDPIDMHSPLWFWSRGGFVDIG